MTRSIWTLALFLLVLHTYAFAAELTVRDPHVRSVELELLDDLQKGAQASPTLKSLLDRLEILFLSRMVQLLVVERRYTEFTGRR